MVMKKKILIASISIVILITLSYIGISQSIEPFDTFARSDEPVKCPDGSLSVVTYRRKIRWFASETELFVRVTDNKGRVVHEEMHGPFSLWNDSEMKIREMPEAYCNQSAWRKNADVQR